MCLSALLLCLTSFQWRNLHTWLYFTLREIQPLSKEQRNEYVWIEMQNYTPNQVKYVLTFRAELIKQI